MSWWNEFARIWEGKLPHSEVPLYLIENSDYFDRPGIYHRDMDPDHDRDAQMAVHREWVSKLVV